MDTKATFNGVSKNVLELTCSAFTNVIIIFIGATFVSPGDVADVWVPVVVNTLGLGVTGDVTGVGWDVITCVESNDVVDCPSAVFTTTVFAVVPVIILEDVSTIEGVVVSYMGVSTSVGYASLGEIVVNFVTFDGCHLAVDVCSNMIVLYNVVPSEC